MLHIEGFDAEFISSRNTHLNIHIYMNIHMYIYIYKYKYIQRYIYMSKYVYICVYTYHVYVLIPVVVVCEKDSVAADLVWFRVAGLGVRP